MISCYLQGGLGNQMFQIAATISLAVGNSDMAHFNTKYHHLPLQGRRIETYRNNIFRHLIFSEDINQTYIYQEPGFEYSPISYCDNMILRGYFQSEKYFKNHAFLIRSLFAPSKTTEALLSQRFGHLLKRKTASIHIRRGDYVNNPTHPVQTREYYNKAMKELCEDTQFLIFSDDIGWCKQNYKGRKYHFIEGLEDYQDLFLMPKCDHNIIANSSFSWWGAWLNSNPNKRVIAPKKWFGHEVNLNTKDLIPSGWELF